jgi:hypothetical protein
LRRAQQIVMLFLAGLIVSLAPARLAKRRRSSRDRSDKKEV